jgi:DNA-binding response OmpR family regulator
VSDRSQLRVLVVDDDIAVARLLASLLERQGWARPTIVGTGAEALATAGDHDLILLDYHLPDATGLDLLPAIHARSARPAVVVITAHGSESLAAGALRAGADDYLIKDASLPELLPQVLERVRRHRALREALAAAERDLVHAERLNAIGEMNVTLHHAVNNPLMAAFAELELLAIEEGLTREQREGLAAVKAALQQIRQIVERARSLKHARTEEYAGGVRMIDLSRRTQPMAVDRGRALVALPEEDTARVVGSLLRHAGFRVERVANTDSLGAACDDPDVALVLVAGTDGSAGSDPLGGFRPSPTDRRRATVVALVAGDGTAARAAGADHVVTLPFDPGTFTSDLLAAMPT